MRTSESYNVTIDLYKCLSNVNSNGRLLNDDLKYTCYKQFGVLFRINITLATRIKLNKSY